MKKRKKFLYSFFLILVLFIGCIGVVNLNAKIVDFGESGISSDTTRDYCLFPTNNVLGSGTIITKDYDFETKGILTANGDGDLLFSYYVIHSYENLGGALFLMTQLNLGYTPLTVDNLLGIKSFQDVFMNYIKQLNLKGLSVSDSFILYTNCQLYQIFYNSSYYFDHVQRLNVANFFARINSISSSYSQFTLLYQFNSNDSFNKGVEQGKIDGYKKGYQSGFDVGNVRLDKYKVQAEEDKILYGKQEYIRGQNDASLSEFTFSNLLSTIFLFPLTFIKEGLNVSIFGINIGGVILGLVALSLVIFALGFLKKLIK